MDTQTNAKRMLAGVDTMVQVVWQGGLRTSPPAGIRGDAPPPPFPC